ncbi:hypothetical protein SRHO_G00292030 [Serrasalmus rhombeus]
MAADIERLALFEETHYDEYEYYNLNEYSCHAGGKGRTKREIGLNTNRHCPAGHERKIVDSANDQPGVEMRNGSWSKCLFAFADLPKGIHGAK